MDSRKLINNIRDYRDDNVSKYGLIRFLNGRDYANQNLNFKIKINQNVLISMQVVLSTEFSYNGDIYSFESNGLLPACHGLIA